MDPQTPDAIAVQPRQQKDPFDDWALWVKDNVEAFVVAFIIALVVRCFCLEVFKIPTGSMTPTLLGDHPAYDSDGHALRTAAGQALMIGGDRIMVSKYMYHLFPPQRYDVVVFKFPLNTARNFIKRLVGLPGDHILVQQGDLYVCPKGESRFRIARKPLRVQESIWIPVFPPEHESANLKDAWEYQPSGAADVQGETMVLDATKASTGDATCTYKSSIIDNVNREAWGVHPSIGDLRLAATVRWVGGEGRVTFRIRSEPDWVEAWLPAKGQGSLRWQKDGGDVTKVEFPSPLADGKAHDVALLNYDGLAHLRIDGEKVAEIPYRDNYDPILRKGTSAATFEVSQGKASFEHVTLHRDLYYTDGQSGPLFPEGRELEIPDHKYLMMGDNSRNSKDGRLWALKTLTLQDDRIIQADIQDMSLNNGVWDIHDIYGVEYHINQSEVKGIPVRTDQPFVDENEIVGKAFYVWWPLSRMKLIR